MTELTVVDNAATLLSVIPMAELNELISSGKTALLKYARPYPLPYNVYWEEMGALAGVVK